MVGNHTELQALRSKAREALVISRSSFASIFDPESVSVHDRSW